MKNLNIIRYWSNHEPAELEYFHGKLIELFHDYRKSITNDTQVLIDGVDFNNIIAKAKRDTYEKYSYLGSVGIDKKEFNERLKTKGNHGIDSIQ